MLHIIIKIRSIDIKMMLVERIYEGVLNVAQGYKSDRELKGSSSRVGSTCRAVARRRMVSNVTLLDPFSILPIWARLNPESAARVSWVRRRRLRCRWTVSPKSCSAPLFGVGSVVIDASDGRISYTNRQRQSSMTKSLAKAWGELYPMGGACISYRCQF